MKKSIQYSLSPNHLQGEANKFFARVEAHNTLDTEHIIARCLNRGTTLTETDLRAGCLLFLEECGRAVSEGFNVNTPLVNMRPSISGSFANVYDSFDPAQHEIRASLSMGLELANQMKESSPEKTRSSIPAPYPLVFEDGNSGTSNDKITPGGSAIIAGEDLKFNPEIAEEGIFFVAQAGGAETKATVILSRTDTKLFLHIPSGLANGSYKVEVRRTYTSANTVRKGEIQAILTVG